MEMWGEIGKLHEATVFCRTYEPRVFERPTLEVFDPRPPLPSDWHLSGSGQSNNLGTDDWFCLPTDPPRYSILSSLENAYAANRNNQVREQLRRFRSAMVENPQAARNSL